MKNELREKNLSEEEIKEALAKAEKTLKEKIESYDLLKLDQKIDL